MFTHALIQVHICTCISVSDMDRPQWQSCPINMIRFIDRGSDVTAPVWIRPVAVDNSGESLNVVLRTGFESGTPMVEGSYEIVYDVSDSTGNAATPCRFAIDIRGIYIDLRQKKIGNYLL